ncbi:ASFV-G-ACD-00350 [African swine fever virus]|nr:ASFV-G-ACD-00350 [African swine fever virus]UYE97405.1 ASFV G ACD 00350 [African swine fever virus]
MFDSLLPTITGGGSLIALALLWFADYYVEFIEARLDSNITAV